MILCVSEVMNRGYKRVGFFGNPKHAPWHLFEAGYLKAQQQLPARQRLASLHLLDTAKDTQRALEQWIKKQKPDAIITANPGLPDMLEKAGVRYPDDIGVAATSTLDANVDAGIYQNSEEIGRVAVLLLISLIHDNDVGVPARFREVLIKGDFVDGKSLPKR
jgi:LacI family transcriptional regulator